MTLIDWLKDWLRIYKIPYITPGSVERLETVVRLHVPDWLKSKQLDTLRALDVDRAISECKRPRTRKYLYFTLRNALRKAYCVDLIPQDITLKMQSVRYRAQTGRALTITEQARFLEATVTCKYSNLFRFYLLTDARRSEALGLKWADIDWQLGQIHIRGTKTESSDRIIYILPELAEVLRKQHEQTGNGDRVFPYEKANVSHAFGKYCPAHRLHDLRHTFVTRCAENGININVAQQLAGHSDISTTLKIYTHVTTEFSRAEFAKFRLDPHDKRE